MRQGAVGVAVTVLVLFHVSVSSAFAAPQAFWGGPWQVTLGGFDWIEHAEIKRAFGGSADKDGEPGLWCRRSLRKTQQSETGVWYLRGLFAPLSKA